MTAAADNAFGRRLAGLDQTIMSGLFAVVMVQVGYAVWSQSTTTTMGWNLGAGVLLLTGMWLILFAGGATMSRRARTVAVVLLSAGFAIDAATWDLITRDNAQLWSMACGLISIGSICLRGRPGAAIVVYLSLVATHLWGWDRLGHPMVVVILEMVLLSAFLLIALYISSYVRPTIRDILALRLSAQQSARSEAAALGAITGRNARIDWINRVAGPWLRRIAAGSALSASDREECRLLEARVRDALRAPGLDGEALAESATAARRRGIDVVLLDDGALVGVQHQVMERLHARVSEVLESAGEGRVTVRIAPPGRAEVATILTTAGDASERVSLSLADPSVRRTSH